MDPGEGSCALCGVDPYGAMGDLELQFSVFVLRRSRLLSERTESCVGAHGVLCVPRIQERVPAVLESQETGEEC